jgi:hypothetical protein
MWSARPLSAQLGDLASCKVLYTHNLAYEPNINAMNLSVSTKSFDVYGQSGQAVIPGTCNCWCCCCCHFTVFESSAA